MIVYAQYLKHIVESLAVDVVFRILRMLLGILQVERMFARIFGLSKLLLWGLDLDLGLGCLQLME